MVDLLLLALTRRDELSRELEGLDDFVRTAEWLLTGDQARPAPPRVDPFQALFNSGEVLPPLSEDDGDWKPMDAEGVRFVRPGPGET